MTSVNDTVGDQPNLCCVSEKLAYDGNVTARDALQGTVGLQWARANPNGTGEANQEH